MRTTPLFQTTTSSSRNRPRMIRSGWISPCVVRRIPVRNRWIGPQPHSNDSGARGHDRVESISLRPNVHRQAEILRASISVRHAQADWKGNRGVPSQRYYSELLSVRSSHPDTVNADIEDIGRIKEAAPEPREIFAGRVFDTAEEIARRGMLERPRSDVLTKCRVEGCWPHDVVAKSQ